MMKRHFLGLVMALALLAVPHTTTAQTTPNLPQVYTWEPYGLSVRYPQDWTVDMGDNLVSLHPTGRDVSDGQGPEMVLFVLLSTGEDQLDSLAGTFASDINGTTTPPVPGRFENHATRMFTFDQTDPNTVGGLMLIATENQTVLGIAYTVRDEESSMFLPSLTAMRSSLTFGDPSTIMGGVSFGSANRGNQIYQDDTYGYELRFPRAWLLSEGSKPGEIALHPPDVEVTASDGPEFVVLVLDELPTSSLDEILTGLTEGRPGTFSPPESATLDGHDTRLVTYTNSDRTPALSGGVYLVQISDQVVLAVGYRAVEPDYATTYQAVFDSIRQSMHFTAPAADSSAPETSEGVASVQLPMRYPWDGAGMVLYFPQDWTVDATQAEDGTYNLSSSSPSTGGKAFVIQGLTMTWISGLGLRDVAEALAGTTAGAGDIVDLTVADHPAVTFDSVDDSSGSALHLRTLVIAFEEREMAVAFMFGAPEADWPEFRPVVDAFIASLEVSPVSLNTDHPIRARAYWIPGSTPLPTQDGGDTQEYDWPDYGITVVFPASWQAIPGNSSDFDLALVSPEAISTNTGAYITLRHIPALGSGVTVQSALESVAEEVSGEVEEYALAGLEGAAVHITDDENNIAQHLILVPYGPDGEAFYIQTVAPIDQDSIIQDILASLTMEPVVPDMDLVDAAWQQSLEEHNTLIYGEPDAPLTMVEFFDFSCSHCAEYSMDIHRLIALEVEPGNVRIEAVVLDIIGGTLSNNAAQATYCAAEQGKGYTAYKTLFHGYINQGRDTAYSLDGIRDLLGGVGLDIDALDACLDVGTYAGLVTANNARSDDAGVNATPTVLFATGDDEPAFLMLQDQPWSGAIPLVVIRAAVEHVKAGKPLADLTKDLQ